MADLDSKLERISDVSDQQAKVSHCTSFPRIIAVVIACPWIVTAAGLPILLQGASRRGDWIAGCTWPGFATSLGLAEGHCSMNVARAQG